MLLDEWHEGIPMVNRRENTARKTPSSRATPDVTSPAKRHRSGVLPTTHLDEPPARDPSAGGLDVEGQFAAVEQLARRLANVADELTGELTVLRRKIDEQHRRDRLALAAARDIANQAQRVAAVELDQRCSRIREDHARQVRELARGYREVLQQVRKAGSRPTPDQ